MFQPGQEPELAPGVRGILFDEPDEVIIPVVYATEEGSGEFGAWLDTLPTDRTVTFSTVLNPRLANMLKRRGYTLRTLEDSEGNPYEVMRRSPGPIQVSPNVCGGKPVLAGTRFMVGQLLTELAEGMTVQQVAKKHDVDPELAKKGLQKLAWMMGQRS
jgi:uncharacterized protein (DUF433 family)